MVEGRISSRTELRNSMEYSGIYKYSSSRLRNTRKVLQEQELK